MYSQKIYIYKLIIISSLIILSKYIVSYFLNFEEDLFFKIIRLGEEDFESYALIVESLSHLNLKTNFSESIVSEKIIGFPFLSLIWHSFFFKFFGYYSFLFLEIIFYFLLLLLLFKIFLLISKNYDYAFISVISLLLILEIVIFLINSELILFSKISNKIFLPLHEFYGQRFPKPLVTSVYFFGFIYIVAKFNAANNVLFKPKYAFWLGVCSIFLMNSFFFHFVKVSIFLLIFFLYKFKFSIFKILKKNFLSISIYSIMTLIGFCILILQLNYAEPDYLNRIGIYKINLNEKLKIIQIFIKKIFQFEILAIIILCFVARYNYKNLDINKNNKVNYDFLLIFFISTLLSPLIFTTFINKFTHINYFWSAVKFFGFLYIFSIFMKLIFLYKLKINFRTITIFLSFILLSLSFYNNYTKQISYDNQIIYDRNEVKEFLNKKEFKETNKTFYSKGYALMHNWLKQKNKYLIKTEGFVSSYSDEILENLIFNYFKMTNISKLEFEKKLNQNEDTQYKRNNFAANFNYKYSVNSIRHYKPIKEEYSPNIVKRINNLSPLIQWHLFFPNSEKKRLLEKYSKFKINKNLMPDLVIIKKSNKYKKINLSLIELEYEKIFSNQTFSIYKNFF